MTLEEVAAEARQQQIDSLDQVRWAVVEGNGPHQLHHQVGLGLLPTHLQDG